MDRLTNRTRPPGQRQTQSDNLLHLLPLSMSQLLLRLLPAKWPLLPLRMPGLHLQEPLRNNRLPCLLMPIHQEAIPGLLLHLLRQVMPSGRAIRRPCPMAIPCRQAIPIFLPLPPCPRSPTDRHSPLPIPRSLPWAIRHCPRKPFLLLLRRLRPLSRRLWPSPDLSDERRCPLCLERLSRGCQRWRLLFPRRPPPTPP